MTTLKTWDFSTVSELPDDLSPVILDYNVPAILSETDHSYFPISDDKLKFKRGEQPAGVFHGTTILHKIPTGEVSVIRAIFSNPISRFKNVYDDFSFVLQLGFCDDQASEWICSSVKSRYSAGTWVDRLKLTQESVSGLVTSVLQEEEFGDDFSFVDENEMYVEYDKMRGTITVVLNGVLKLTYDVDKQYREKSVFHADFYGKYGVFEDTFPLISSFEETVEEKTGRFSMSELPDLAFPLQPDIDNFFVVPVRELEESGKLRKLSENSWEFLEETVIKEYLPGGRVAPAGSKIVGVRKTHRNEMDVVCKFYQRD